MATCWWTVQNASTGKTSVVSGTCDITFTSPAGTVTGGPFKSQAAAQASIGGPAPKASGPGPNGRYSYAQLEGLWINAGGSRSMAPLMAAIAEAESGGDPNATGGVGEKGLWQINPAAWGSLATYDPLGNAKAAVHVLAVQGLTAWSTYTSGAYKAFLSNSTTPDTSVSGSGGGGSSGGSGGSGSSSGGITATVLTSAQKNACALPLTLPVVGQTCLLQKSQARALIGGALMAAGAVLVLPGLAVLAAAGFAQTRAGQAAASSVAAVRRVPFVP